MKKILLIVLGSIFLVLGGIGVFIPIFPTTPFVLLAATCYATSSQRLYHKLYNSRILGVFIQNYKNKTGIPLSYKIFTISFLWISLGISIYFVDILWVRILLGAIGAAVTIHVLTIRTKKKNK